MTRTTVSETSIAACDAGDGRRSPWANLFAHTRRFAARALRHAAPRSLRAQFALAHSVPGLLLLAVGAPVLVGRSGANAYVVVAWLALGVAAASLIGWLCLSRLLLTRLQAVGRALRLDGGAGQAPRPAHGGDEMDEMASAVERCLAERRQLAAARTRFEEGQQRLQAIVDHMADGIVVLQDARIAQINPAAERMFGVRPRQVVGQPVATLLPDFESHPESSCGITCETIARTAHGATLPVEVSVSSPGTGASSSLSVLVVRDVTLRKETEQHLIAARDAAETARATQARFLANMSHELRTPLNAVMGYAQVLLYQSTLTERQRLAAGTIRNSGEHLLALITDLLDLAKSDAGKLELCPTPVRLADFLRVTSDIVRVKAEEARLAFRCEMAADAPAVIVADESRLRQILLNLLSNAVKFTDRGDVVLSVDVLQRGAGRVRLRFGVRDTGVGIRDDQLDAIFRPFEQVGEARHRAAGTGLGLAISQQLVRAMGGELSVSSAPGKGSSFAFELELPVASDTPRPEAPQHAITGYEGPRKRILLADDVAANRLLLSDMLRPLGFEIDEAGDGRQAIDQARASTPDLIIMDLVMPVMSGAQAIRLLRQTRSLTNVPIIAVSANSNAPASRVGRDERTDADAFVAKPLMRERVLQEVGACLSLRWTHATASPVADGDAAAAGMGVVQPR